MWTRLLVVFIALAASRPAAPQTAVQIAGDFVAVGIGQTAEIPIEGDIVTTAVEAPELASARIVNPHKVEITGVSVGRTMLEVETAGGHVTRSVCVWAQNPEKVIEAVSAALRDLEGPSLVMVCDRLIVKGETVSKDDAAIVAKLAVKYGLGDLTRPSRICR